jgi:hypothetical protein
VALGGHFLHEGQRVRTNDDPVATSQVALR